MSKHLWVTDAERVCQGSFCDATSQIHYNNYSREGMDDAISRHQEQGLDISDLRDERDATVVADGRLNPVKLVASRNNCTILEVDNHSFDYPAKYGPGN